MEWTDEYGIGFRFIMTQADRQRMGEGETQMQRQRERAREEGIDGQTSMWDSGAIDR